MIAKTSEPYNSIDYSYISAEIEQLVDIKKMIKLIIKILAKYLSTVLIHKRYYIETNWNFPMEFDKCLHHVNLSKEIRKGNEKDLAVTTCVFFALFIIITLR